MFLDGAAKQVELKNYPNDQPGVEPPLWPSVWSSLKFTGMVIVVNVILVPLYIIGIFFPPLLLVIFLVNGWLLGREYFELVGYRHLRQAASMMRVAETRRQCCSGASPSH